MRNRGKQKKGGKKSASDDGWEDVDNTLKGQVPTSDVLWSLSAFNMVLGGIIFVGACAVYSNTLGHGFTLDDQSAVTGNAAVHDYSVPMSRLFRTDFWGDSMADPDSHKSFRPVTTL